MNFDKIWQTFQESHQNALRTACLEVYHAGAQSTRNPYSEFVESNRTALEEIFGEEFKYTTVEGSAQGYRIGTCLFVVQTEKEMAMEDALHLVDKFLSGNRPDSLYFGLITPSSNRYEKVSFRVIES